MTNLKTAWARDIVRAKTALPEKQFWTLVAALATGLRAKADARELFSRGLQTASRFSPSLDEKAARSVVRLALNCARKSLATEDWARRELEQAERDGILTALRRNPPGTRVSRTWRDGKASLRIECPQTARPGRSARVATNTHVRGSRRAAATSTSGSSQDPGDSDPEPSEPPERRLCQLPGCDRPARRKYCTDQHADLGRQRRHRAKSRPAVRPVRFGDLVAEGISAHAYDIPDTHIVGEVWVPPETPGRPSPPRLLTLDDLKLRVWCQCNGHHIELADDPGHCVKCGHKRRNGVAA